MVLSSLAQLCRSSRRSLVGFHSHGLTRIALDNLYPDPSVNSARLDDSERGVWKTLLDELLELGAGPLEIRTLCQRAVAVESDQNLRQRLKPDVLQFM